MPALNRCPECLARQRVIDRLEQENQCLRDKLRYQERKAQEGFFGSSTPPSKLPLKPNTPPERKPRGAKKGHTGHGRKTFDPLSCAQQNLSHEAFSIKAKSLKYQIIATIRSSAKHLAIRRIQDIFRENKTRLYHWADKREVPAENNLAERDLRPTVIARKVSFGSQSDAGAQTRGVLMSVLYTLKKRGVDVGTHLKMTLDQLAKNPKQNPYPLLFPSLKQKTRASPTQD